MRRNRADMIVATRGKLIAAARAAFSRQGYADAPMEEITAAAGLTRGALYHHFGDKRGLFAAVVAQIDAEIDGRLQDISAQAMDDWQGFHDRCHAYLALAGEAEIRQLVLRDARAVLGESERASARCVASIAAILEKLKGKGRIRALDCEAMAWLIHGGLESAACWIADGAEPGTRLNQCAEALNALLNGLRTE